MYNIMMYVKYRCAERNMFRYTGCLYWHCVFSDRLFTHSLICTFLVILVFSLHVQNTSVSNNIWPSLRQSDLDTNLKQNLNLINFHVLLTTKMKKTISHITVLVNLIKLSYFNIIQSCPHYQWNYTQRYKSTLIAVLSLWGSIKRKTLPHTDRTASNISQGRNGDVNSGGRTNVHCYRQT